MEINIKRDWITENGDHHNRYHVCQVMTNLDSILKSRDITLPTKVRLVKAMAFPVSQFFTSGGQIIGASASVLPMNIQD